MSLFFRTMPCVLFV
uniref:Uncharacterized protein n=1 Tax=Anguilla anguilla TaxID=7936 RepID=A0A0E9UDH2_ANGAN